MPAIQETAHRKVIDSIRMTYRQLVMPIDKTGFSNSPKIRRMGYVPICSSVFSSHRKQSSALSIGIPGIGSS